MIYQATRVHQNICGVREQTVETVELQRPDDQESGNPKTMPPQHPVHHKFQSKKPSYPGYRVRRNAIPSAAKVGRDRST